MQNIFISVVIAYLVGSIPTAIWIGKITKKIDIRNHGSGNAGATNAVRVLGWKLGSFVLVFDILKGFFPVFYLPEFFPYNELGDIYRLALAVAAVIGHIYPIFAGFNGGKGVGTAAGAFAAIIPYSFFIAFLTFIILVALFRYVSLGSISGAISIIVTLPLFKNLRLQDVDTSVIYIIIVICILIIYRHKANIARLLKGEENKIKFEGKS